MAEADNGNGCIARNFVTVSVDSSTFIYAAPDTGFCSPTPVQLNAITAGPAGTMVLNCGTNGTRLSNHLDTLIIGTSTNITITSTPFKGSWQDGRLQLLYHASELTTTGESAIITGIGLNISFKNSVLPFGNFMIKVGCTNLNDLGNSFVNLPGVVFGPYTINTTQGLNIFSFDSTYDWDGTSNLIIEFCFDNNSYDYDDAVNYTNTPFVSVTFAAGDFVPGGGCNLNTPFLTVSRPNIQLFTSMPPMGIFWSPSIGLSDPYISNPIAFPDTTTSYTAYYASSSCTVVDQMVVSVGLNLNNFQNNIVCDGSTTGIAVSQPLGGTAPYNFSWSNGSSAIGQMTDTIYNLSPGTYTLTVSDATNCMDSSLVVVSASSSSPSIVLTGMQASCFNCNNGIAAATVTGGVPPYTYHWNTGSNDSAISDLLPGTYYLTVDDINQCSSSDSIAIGFPIGMANRKYSVVKIYPNPSAGVFNLEIYSPDVDEIKIEWLDLLGKTILTDLESHNSFTKTYDLSEYRSGIYFIKISGGGKVFREKVVMTR